MLLDKKLEAAGFPLQAVVNIDDVGIELPIEARSYRQLIVLGSGGQSLWEHVRESGAENPIDEYSIRCMSSFLEEIDCPEYRILYPTSSTVIDLLGLGRDIGWHGDSLMGIGINSGWGTWFAYRVVVAVNSDLPVSTTGPYGLDECDACQTKACVSACPVGAVSEQHSFDFDACRSERTATDSACAYQCLARVACPVGDEHQYESDQLNYHYRQSLITLKNL